MNAYVISVLTKKEWEWLSLSCHTPRGDDTKILNIFEKLHPKQLEQKIDSKVPYMKKFIQIKNHVPPKEETMDKY